MVCQALHEARVSPRVHCFRPVPGTRLLDEQGSVLSDTMHLKLHVHRNNSRELVKMQRLELHPEAFESEACGQSVGIQVFNELPNASDVS